MIFLMKRRMEHSYTSFQPEIPDEKKNDALSYIITT